MRLWFLVLALLATPAWAQPKRLEIEAPDALQTLLATLSPTTRLSVSSGLVTPQSRTTSAPVAQWRERKYPGPDNDTPAVFGIGP